MRLGDLARRGPRRPAAPSISSLGLPAFSASSRCAATSFLISRVRDVERVEDLGLGDLVGARLDHQDGLVGARHDEVEVGLEQLLLGRVDDEVALDLADPHGADRAPGTGCRRPASAADAPFMASTS